MTQSELLCYLHTSTRRSESRLQRVYGDAWRWPMRGLIDLGIAVAYQCGRAELTFHLVKR
jgi:hypothetical protein